MAGGTVARCTLESVVMRVVAEKAAELRWMRTGGALERVEERKLPVLELGVARAADVRDPRAGPRLDVRGGGCVQPRGNAGKARGSPHLWNVKSHRSDSSAPVDGTHLPAQLAECTYRHRRAGAPGRQARLHPRPRWSCRRLQNGPLQ